MTAIATPANRAGLRALLRAEKEQFTELLRGLSAEQWQAQSLCAGWTVRDLAAHLAAPGRLPFFRLSLRMTLLETVVHQQDIRRPLDVAREIPADVLCTVLPIAARTYRARTGGLRLQAFDLPWIRDDDGPSVTGPGEALLMAMCGRPAALAELTGAGVPILTARIGRTPMPACQA